MTETLDQLGIVDESVVERIGWPAELSVIAKVLADDTECAMLANSQAALWETIAARLSNGRAPLIITHGAILELGVVASLKRSNQPVVGQAFAYCEGVRLYFSGHCSERAEQLRLPSEMRLVNS